MDYSKLSYNELKNILKTNSVKGRASLTTKQKMIDALNNNNTSYTVETTNNNTSHSVEKINNNSSYMVERPNNNTSHSVKTTNNNSYYMVERPNNHNTTIKSTETINVNMAQYCERYHCNLNNIKDVLEKYGVAILPNLLDEDEIKLMNTGMWDMLKNIQNDAIDVDKPDTWTNFYRLYPLHSMLLQHFGIGHSQYIWDLRQNTKIINVFSKIWDTNELLVSFDGVSVHLPHEKTKRGWYKGNKWYHTDQSFTRNNFECVQSWVTGYDVNDGDATLSVMEGSHKFHETFAKTFNVTDKKDWYKLNDLEIDFYLNNNCKQVNIVCPKGSLVLWDSRTIHCGKEPDHLRKKENFRHVVYLCYTPKSLATEKNIKKRIEYFETLRLTSHWPHKPKLFSKLPRTYGKDVPTINPISTPKLNELGRKLIGYM